MIGLIFKILTLPIRLIFGGRSGSPMGGLLKLGLILVIVVAVLRSCTSGYSGSQSSIVRRSSSTGNTSLVVSTPPSFGKPHYYTSEPTVAPLRISTQSGCNYFVVLKDNKTKETKVDVYLQGGQDAEFMVPAGEYEIEYSAGITWYGKENLFGPETQTAKAAGVATFKKGVGVSFSVHRNR